MAQRFYTPEVLSPGEFVLSGTEAHHVVVVMRLGIGQQVVLFNGDGCEYPAELIALGKKSVALRVGNPQVVNRELPFPLVIASALPKGDRTTFLIEKLTELGVTRFVPLLTTRSVVRPTTAVVEKLTRGVVEASKQCGRNRLLVVEPPQEWDQLLARADLPSRRVVLHTAGELPLRASPDGVVVGIGPEGGFSPEEMVRARHAGWSIASLGPRVVRVETAGIAAASVLGVG